MSHSEEGVWGGSKMWLIYFLDSDQQGREKIVEKTNGNLSREGGSGKEYRNNGIGVLTCYDCPDFGQIKTSRPDEVWAGKKGGSTKGELENLNV